MKWALTALALIGFLLVIDALTGIHLQGWRGAVYDIGYMLAGAVFVLVMLSESSGGK